MGSVNIRSKRNNGTFKFVATLSFFERSVEEVKMRKSWDHYFMDMAYMAATRATCPRRHVGAILVKDKKILGTAYNGSPAGTPDCYEDGCLMTETYEEENGQMVRKQRCIRTIHAEQNLLLFTDREDRQFLGEQPPQRGFAGNYG
jgi:deoxycytidylate deaminase